MNSNYERSLINSLLINEDLNVDWEYVITQSEIEKWQISQSLSQKILEDFSRYSTSQVKNIICFFSLDAQLQIDLLPHLDQPTLFDFSDGDLRTDKALLVFANQYMDTINSLSNRLLILELEAELIILETAMWDIYAWIDRQDWENEDFWYWKALLNSEWQFMRKLSRFVQQYLNIEVTVTKSCLKQIIIDCLHP